MLDGPVDPASLEGDDLLNWYRRSPWDIEKQRQAARRQQYMDFFGVDPGGSDSEQGPGHSDPTAQSPDQSGRSQASPQTTFPTPSFGPNGYVPGLLGDLSGLPDSTSQSTVGGSPSDQTGAAADQQAPTGGDDGQPKPLLDAGLATDGDADWIPVGGKTPGQRRRWSQHYGQDWPKVPETGQNYHLHHFTPKADGGTEELNNYGPMEPSAHVQHHIDNGDFSRWAKRRWAPKPGVPEVSGLGILQLIPDITGILSGRIRMDSMDNFFSDMLGVPSQEDIRQYHERLRQKLAPNSPPGTWIDVA